MKSTDLIGHIKFLPWSATRPAKGVACKTNPGSGHNNNLLELVQVDLTVIQGLHPSWNFNKKHGEYGKKCGAFTMARKRFRYILEVSHKHNKHMIISINLATLNYLCSVVIFEINFKHCTT